MSRIKTILAAVVSVIALASCEQEIADFTNRLDDLENRVSKLEQLCSEMNSNISSLQSIVTAMQNGDYITSVKEITEGGKTVGYTITFAKGEPITIYHGQDGQDGHTPVIGVKQDSDGIWYWTVDSEWLLDTKGHKLKAAGTDGKNGVTPQLKIENGYWYVSTDNGQTWTMLGKATGEDGSDGDTLFQSVNVTENEVTFVMADGQTFVIKRASFLASRIQSLSYIPRYTDGASTMWIKVLADGTLEVRDTLDFRVSPADCVDALVAAWQNVLSVDAVTVVTRAPSDEAITIPITSVSGANGKLSVVLDGFSLIPVVTSDLSYLSQLRASLIISDGNNERASEYLEIVPVWKEILAPYAIDLGLSVKWAMCNVGATAIEGCGDYFAWGETETKENYSWETYEWSNGSYNTLNKYTATIASYYFNNPVDNKTVLDPEDDVAHVILGGDWRMPTYTDWTELLNKCTWSWTTLNGMSGHMVTGPNGNSIFLPAAGRRINNKLVNDSDGYYWSSSLYTPNYSEDSWSGYFTSSWKGSSRTQRNCGIPVRPVYGEFIHVSGITLDKSSVTLNSWGESIQLSATITPLNALENRVVWSSSDKDVALVSSTGLVMGVGAGETTITASSGDGGFTASCLVTVNLPEAVDLGLGVKWATCNLCETGFVSSPLQNGDYYAWGETERKNEYNWSTYKWCNGSYNSLTKYNTRSDCGYVDNRIVLDIEDDAAHAILGDLWRLPTEAEWIELINKCTWTWLNDANGYQITGVNGNSIFLPCAGRRKDSKLYNFDPVEGSTGYYWSSDYSYDRYAYYLEIGISNSRVTDSPRYFGYSIRPVSE